MTMMRESGEPGRGIQHTMLRTQAVALEMWRLRKTTVMVRVVKSISTKRWREVRLEQLVGDERGKVTKRA